MLPSVPGLWAPFAPEPRGRQLIAGAKGVWGRGRGRESGNAHSSCSEGGAALRQPPPGPWVPCLLPWSSRLHEESPCLQGPRPGHWRMCIHSGQQASLALGAKFPLCPQRHQIHNNGAKTGQWRGGGGGAGKPLGKGRRSSSILFGAHPAVLGGAGGPNSALDPLLFAGACGGFMVFPPRMGHHWRCRLQVYGWLAGLRFPSVSSGQTG